MRRPVRSRDQWGLKGKEGVRKGEEGMKRRERIALGGGHTWALHPLGSGSLGFFMRALTLPCSRQGHQYAKQPVVRRCQPLAVRGRKKDWVGGTH